jgi:uncharacterized membrane protein YkvA (DUF1232 family)
VSYLEFPRPLRYDNARGVPQMDMTLWRTRAKRLKSEIQSLYLAARDPRTPWYAKALAACIIGYALSPVDLIPDFIPVIGYLDDLIIVPAGITILIKIMPKEVLQECRAKAQSQPISFRKNWVAGMIIALIWLFLIYLAASFAWGIVKS